MLLFHLLYLEGDFYDGVGVQGHGIYALFYQELC